MVDAPAMRYNVTSDRVGAGDRLIVQPRVDDERRATGLVATFAVVILIDQRTLSWRKFYLLRTVRPRPWR